MLLNVLSEKKRLLLNILFIAIALVIAYALFSIFDAKKILAQADFFLLLLAVLSFVLSIVLWNFGWAQILGIGFIRANKIGFASLSGLLTPFGIGNDLLKGLLAKQDGLSLEKSVAASVCAKLIKMFFAVLLSALGLLSVLYLFPSQFNLLLSLFVLVSGMSVGLFILSRKKFSLEGEGSIAVFTRHLNSFFSRPSFSASLFLLASFLLEFLSFFLCAKAISLDIPFVLLFASFSAVFLAGKIPLSPQGLGIVEFLAVYVLFTASTEAVAALIFLWNICRLWFPILLSAPFYLRFHLKTNH